ncbi:transposase [Corynebacterium sp.]|uniref:transposase n=1 Tax=Corynebacterium sp. TaxID=1720 RepID=UPI0026DAB4D7|nr:transposase [Corynebacterium sp.]MDO5076759.1 transposase [Corynebacterium sp.]
MPMSRQYSPEFQQKAVREVLKAQRDIPEIAREFGVSTETLRNWVTAVQERERLASVQKEQAELIGLREEVAKLRAQVAELQKDRDLVDTLEAFFKERRHQDT